MLESVLADVLTRILGQYLEGIDRDNVTFGAWSGLVELRGVALRSEALAVLFETLGLDLPVTVEAGFIGLLRLQVPWKTIGTTPVQIHMEDITIVARPVRGDGSDNSELENRERRIKRAKLSTDDAVREASWGVSTDGDNSTSSYWSSWVMSDQLRAKIIDNIQIHLKGIILRFEDHFSNPEKPYIASVACKSLKAISVNELWTEAFVERKGAVDTRKLLEIIGFEIDWAPITPEASPGPSRATGHGNALSRFKTPELLRQFLTEGSASTAAATKQLLHPVDGSMRLRLSSVDKRVDASQELREQDPAVDLDIRFPDVHIDLNDVQYASILQTSVYFARLSTRGIRPQTAKARWIWAINQLLPGFSTRRSRALRFSENGIAKARDKRILYVACRKSLLKARRNRLEEPKDMLQNLEAIEDELSFTEILAYRDRVDRIIELEKTEWPRADDKKIENAVQSNQGTTTSSFWNMLGYSDDTATKQGDVKRSEQQNVPASSEKSTDSSRLSLRIGFLLRGATLRLCQGGYPVEATERVALKLRRLHIGVLYAATGELVVESVVGGIEAWDLTKHVRMVYSRLFSEESKTSEDLMSTITSYPHDVSQAIETIRSGSNPARDALLEEENIPVADQMTELSQTEQEDSVSGHQSADTTFSESAEDFERVSRSPRASDTEHEDLFAVANITHRVTEAEFLGNPRDTAGSQKYIAAFRFTKHGRSGDKGDAPGLSQGMLEVSVATLEAVVDGPKGSFLWGLKFWKPKGMVRDPIMALLGAAAGARIAELRIELEEALLANRVPMQINAVIMAPRFIVPGNDSSDPAFVINMGTLGVCTSERSPGLPSKADPTKKLVRYSNYVLTLDDLGVYFCPDLSRAVSCDLSNSTSIDPESHYDRLLTRRTLDTTDVERVIRPFSLRFVLQSLRDSSVVQVAHSSSDEKDTFARNLAKVRVRGTIPGLSVILTLSAFQHLAAAIQTWSEEDYSFSDEGMSGANTPHSRASRSGELLDDNLSVPNSPSSKGGLTMDESRTSSPGDQEESENRLTAMASYDVKVLVQKVSLEIRQTSDTRLVTTVADKMVTSIVKTGRKRLSAEFSLGSLAVTDGSRGSTAAFRRLVYAGNLSGTKGVSPPRSLVDLHEESEPIHRGKENFVTLRYEFDFLSREQKIFLRFLSLNMVCVRETYVRLGMFLSQVREYVKSQRRQRRTRVNEAQDRHSGRSFINAITDAENAVFAQGTSLLQKRLTVTSEFAGFHLQLVASGGTVAVVEMKDSRVYFNRSKSEPTRLWGEFRFFSVQDLTATVDEHMAVVAYNRPGTPGHGFPLEVDQAGDGTSVQPDEWSLTIPAKVGEPMSFKAAFRGIRVTYLARFSDVIRQYMSVLVSELQPVMAGSIDGYELIANDLKATAAVMPQLRTYVVLEDVVLRLPRHSNCNIEALNIRLSSVELTDKLGTGGQTEWTMNFRDLQMAVEYLLSNDNDMHDSVSISSTFLTGVEASLVLKDIEPSSAEGNPERTKCASLSLLSPVRVNLCEAQYTVLYFVLTENLAETISGLDLSTAPPSSPVCEVGNRHKSALADQCEKDSYAEDLLHVMNASSADQVHSEKEDLKNSAMIFEAFIPFLSTEISRGWDVAQDRCKIIGLYMRDITAKLRKSNRYRLLIELEGYLLGLTDLRAERGAGERTVAIPLVPRKDEDQYSSNNERKGNLSLTYDKEGSERPSIVVYMTEFEFELSLSLFRDMTYLAVPGWPFLRSSSFAPDIEYLGRTMNVLLSESQVVLRANEFDEDGRAVVLTGEFLLKVDWKRLTGAKRVSIRSSQFEICTTSTLQPRHRHTDCFGFEERTAEKVKRSQTPLAYPTDSFLEYVGPDVDEDGRRIEFSVDAFLCVICASDIPLLRAVALRLAKSKETYLTTRDWVQPAIDVSNSNSVEQGLTPKEERVKKARENTNLFATIPAARYLLTDDREGRFVSILEARLSSLSITAHGESMIQVGGEASLDLFNAEKGWWEPAIEAWDLTASMSRGHSGTRAFVIRSDRRLNVNITPTSISASMAVAKALKSITTKKKVPDSQQLRLSDTSKVGSSEDVRRPSIAAFLVRNELGIPVNMSMLNSSRKTTIAHNTEVEVGAESESLLTSTSTSDGRSREKALRCLISLLTSEPIEVSASEIGVFPVKFFPVTQAKQMDGHGERQEVAQAVWDVRMMHGVPVCTVRSPLRIGNETKTPLEVNLMSETNEASTKMQTSPERIVRLEPGKFVSISLLDLQSEIKVRPFLRRDQLDSNAFQWSDPLPDLKRLRRGAYEAARLQQDARKPPSTMDMRRKRSKRTIVCKSHLNDDCDFYLTITPETTLHSSLRTLSSTIWVDVALQAPVVLKNKLPERLGYRVFRGNNLSAGKAREMFEGAEAVLAAGLVKPLHDVHLHINRDALDSTFISLAYDNRPRLGGLDNHDSKRVLSDFGAAVSLADLRSGKVIGANVSNYNAASQKQLLALSLLPNVDGSHITAFAGYWVRNRSDTTIEICSRTSFYGAGSGNYVLRQRPPSVEPDGFVCCEGSYLSIRLPREEGHRGNDGQDQSGWWTSTTVLDEVDKPVNVTLPGKTLELEVRPAEGIDCPTHIITIRNSTWIVNRTNSSLQWCQASALDAHGNCRTRLLNSLLPGESQALHWETGSSQRAVHFRLADSVGQSDWIWSPAVPVNIGFSRELPAKMYRPKTHEQYIARVSLKEIAGNCKALVIQNEDRQNPPYRIINRCKERAIAFRQTGSQERHWLVRAGRTTRYSWDDPLARRKHRLLSLRIVAPEELLSGRPLESGGSSSSQRRPSTQTTSHDLQIDVVGNSTISSSDFPRNPVNVNITVDGATKVVTFTDEDISLTQRKPSANEKGQRSSERDSDSDPVLVVGWEDMRRNPQKERRSTTFLSGGKCDYPALSPSLKIPQNSLSSKDADVAVFLESLGVSIVDAVPCELIYFRYKTILFNYESHGGEERYSLSISDLQGDNQLYKTPFPVLLSISSNEEHEKSGSLNETSRPQHAIVLQVHRDVTRDDILMISSFQADIRPANVYLEDRLLSRAIRFLSDSALGDNFASAEVLSGEDKDYQLFRKLTPQDRDGNNDGEPLPGRKFDGHSVSASRRIYVREFGISSSSLRLTSAGSGGALAKAAGLPVSLRALVGMLLNVDNCEFLFAALNVQNVFDSVHHFLVLVREYYVAQLNSQRMKLLASNSLMGNPAALFDAVGTGARVLLNEPGRAKGSTEFIASVGRGSKSLFAHTVGGIVDSVSGIPRALSSGIEAAVGDKDYLAERQRIRGQASTGGHRGSAARNPAQGLATGAVSFAHGISSGVHGFIRDPVQGAKQDGARGLLKGIGKAFIGGVAKPVAGAIDLVAEPAAGLSRQINDAERSKSEHFTAVPDRPPRAFRGRNPRLEVYDRRYALGVYMFQTTQIISGVSYNASLIDWVELSARNGRTDRDSEVWVWEVVQRATRKVPGAKAKSRKGDRLAGREERNGEGIETRPERTRVALVTETEVLVATLDCRLIDVVPLWEEAIYTLHGDGKDLLISVEMPDESGSEKQESSSSLQGTQPFISAPWDASTVGKRKKPSPGSRSTEHIACGSFEARNDLRGLLGEVTKSLGAGHDRHREWKKNEEKRSSGVELSCVDEWSNPNEKEMRSSDHDEHLATSDISRLNWTPTVKGSWASGRKADMARTPASLEKTVRRLSMSKLRKGEDSRHDLRMVLANKLPSELMLRLCNSNLEHGVWRIEAPGEVETLDAQLIDVGSHMEEGTSGMEVSGVVVYEIIENVEEKDKQIGQIVIEFFRGKDEAASFTTRATHGYQAEFVSGSAKHGSAIFTITETPQGQKARLQKKGEDWQKRAEAGPSSETMTSGKRQAADAQVQATSSSSGADGGVGLSNDEMLVQQLVDIGFKFEDAVVALAESEGDMVKAVDILTK